MSWLGSSVPRCPDHIHLGNQVKVIRPSDSAFLGWVGEITDVRYCQFWGWLARVRFSDEFEHWRRYSELVGTRHALAHR